MIKIGKTDYENIAGADWPSYEEYQSGITAPQVEQEINKYLVIPIVEKTSTVVWNTFWNTKNEPENYSLDADHDLVYTRKAHELPSVKTGIEFYCNIPKNYVTIDHKGRVFVCKCEGFVPFPVGTVYDFDSFDEIANATITKQIQSSIDKKEFEFCTTQLCGVRNGDILSNINVIKLTLSIDISCNISCPSCREREIFINDKEIIDKMYAWVQHCFSWVNKTTKTVEIEFAGGDPFASLICCKFVELFKTAKNTRFKFKTNGLLLMKNLAMYEDILDRTLFSISIDAASMETYEIVRRGGRWHNLIQNLKFLKDISKTEVSASFVIQKENFREISEFIKFCSAYNMNPKFSVVDDWGTWHDFAEHCVHLPTSPDYHEFVSIITKHNIKI